MIILFWLVVLCNQSLEVMKKQTIGYLLTLLILSQSCVVYQKTSVPLSEAHNQGRVKVTNTVGMNFDFLNIELRDGVYYGLHKKSITRLYSAQISSIYLQDKQKSKTQSIAFGASIISFLLALIIYGFATMTFTVSM